MNLERDFAKLTAELKDKGELCIALPYLASIEETVAHGLVSKAISYVRQTPMQGTVHLIVSELLANAEEALLKRSYAESEGAETQNQPFLEKFSKHKARLLEKWRDEQPQNADHISLKILISDESLSIEVINEGTVDPMEKRFIQMGQKLGTTANTFSELKSRAQPNFQGDGMGLPVAIMAIRRAQLPPSALSWRTEDDRTIFTLVIPSNHVTESKLKQIDQNLIQEIKALPAFPEQIRQIQTLCESENSGMKEVADAISKDTAIAGQIIKLANSGGFGGGNIVEVFDAVQVVGLKNISDILLQVGALKILTDRYKVDKKFIEHPVRVGFYSRSLANLHGKEELADKAYMAGLLHDIGKVVLLSCMDGKSEFERITEKRDRRNQFQFEEIAAGVSHAVIGALLAHKWKFPDILKKAIEFHHTPYQVPKDFREIVYIVYMANSMANFMEEEISYYAIEPDVLAYFNMTTEESFQMTAASLEEEFRSQN